MFTENRMSEMCVVFYVFIYFNLLRIYVLQGQR